jgi:hypothetical protein
VRTATLYHREFLQSRMLQTDASQHYHGHMEREHQQQCYWSSSSLNVKNNAMLRQKQLKNKNVYLIRQKYLITEKNSKLLQISNHKGLGPT